MNDVRTLNDKYLSARKITEKGLPGYRRTVLVLLPQLWWGAGPLLEGPSTAYALEMLKVIPARERAEEDRHVIQFVLDAVDAQAIQIDQCLAELCATALNRTDPDLWRVAFAKCTSSPFHGVIEFAVIEAGFKAFGSDVVLRRSVRLRNAHRR